MSSLDGHAVPLEVATRLKVARREYLSQQGIEHYDEVLDQVADQARADGHLGKAQIGALLFWKRLRADTPWVTALHLLPDAEVRSTTSTASQAMSDERDVEAAARAGRSALLGLPGFRHGAALASAVLTALAPDRMAIYDIRAHVGLARLGLSIPPNRYSTYMGLVERLRQSVAAAQEEDWSARDVDVALFTLGGRSQQRRVEGEK